MKCNQVVSDGVGSPIGGFSGEKSICCERPVLQGNVVEVRSIVLLAKRAGYIYKYRDITRVYSQSKEMRECMYVCTYLCK